MLGRNDEGVHAATSDHDWQENFLFHGWDATFDNGVYLHLQHIAAESMVDVRAGACIDGVMTSHVLQRKGESAFAAAGLEVEIVVPFEHVRLKYRGAGRLGPDRLGWLFSSTGESPFGFEIDLTSYHPPIEWLPITRKLFPSDPTGFYLLADHYEIGARWRGRVWSGGKEETIEGLMWRDHSWGPRRIKCEAAFWTPVVLDNAKRSVSAVTAFADGKWYGFAAEADSSGATTVWSDYWVRPDGPTVARGFKSATAVLLRDDRASRLEFAVQRVLPAPRNWPVSGQPQRGLVDNASRVQFGDHVGIGTCQHSPVALSDVIDTHLNGAHASQRR